ncbi:hypothetical protein [Amycolatopsis anabasis]|uniref:hypothetical protein n=1 Tax=Amycolatopsis anabasis TaxID=1840409 RepID=UPI00131AD923|nr:hypothetical protein [Amycolatopsis anabasis]
MATIELGMLATELHNVVDEVASMFGGASSATVDGDLDCPPGDSGRLIRWQYGVRLDAPEGARENLAYTVLPSMWKMGWQSKDRGNEREFVVQFFRDGAQVNVHVARTGGDVAIIGSTRCVPTDP